MSSSSPRLISCTHSFSSEGSATLSLGIVSPSGLSGETPMPRQFHINLSRGQVDSITLGLQRIAQQLGSAAEE